LETVSVGTAATSQTPLIKLFVMRPLSSLSNARIALHQHFHREGKRDQLSETHPAKGPPLPFHSKVSAKSQGDTTANFKLLASKLTLVTAVAPVAAVA
jgi:hypothetical protein